MSDFAKGKYNTNYFLGFLAGLKSAQTRKVYRGTLQEYMSFTEKNDLYETTPEDGERYYRELLARVKSGKLTDRTMNDKLYRLRSISKDALERSSGNGFTDPFYRIFPHNPSGQELQLPSYASVKILLSKVKDEQFLILLELILYCGLALNEALQLTGADIRPTRIRITAIGHAREISVPPQLHAKLWSRKQLVKAEQPIFQNRLGRPYNSRYVERKLREYGDFTPQQLRSFALASMYAYGIDAKRFTRYTGIVRPEYYKRFQRAAENISESFPYPHIP